MKRHVIPMLIVALCLSGCTVAIVRQEEFVMGAPTRTFTPVPSSTPFPSSTARLFPTRTPWPNAPLPQTPLGTIPCDHSPLNVTLSWTPTMSEHAVVRYVFVVEGAVEASQDWQRIESGSTAEPSTTITLDCNFATFYRWRVQAQDERNSIGPWSSYAFFQISAQMPGERPTALAPSPTPTPATGSTTPVPMSSAMPGERPTALAPSPTPTPAVGPTTTTP